MDHRQVSVDPQPRRDTNPSIPSAEYTHEYYQSCEGHEEFFSSQGRLLTPRLRLPLEFAALEPGMRVVDVGCGRGEIVLHAALAQARVVGMDYSWEAVKIAAATLRQSLPQANQALVALQQTDARFLPFASDSIDRVFMLDVVEHLYPDELNQALDEVHRVLKPGGWLVVHTMPNLWYYRFGYPLYRFLQRLRGHSLPKNPRERWPFIHFHVNEQTPTRLKHVLIDRRFQTRVWLRNAQTYSGETNLWIRRGMDWVTKMYPIQLIFCNDIFAVGVKSG